MLRPLEMAHRFLNEVITKEDVVVDATMGNGHDTAFLAERAGQVYAFDIQEQALVNTREKLDQLGLQNVQLILDGHQHVDHYVTNLKAAIFNLGYLPAADKSVIMIYYGHAGGDLERDAVLDFVSQLPQKDYTATIYRTLNQVNQPPFLVMIEKLESYRHG